MTEVFVSVEVYNRRVRCNQVSDAIVASCFLYSFNLLEIAYRLPFACNSALFCNASGNKCQRMTLSQYFRFISELKTDVAKDKS